jgi:hypothetical protein
MVDPELRDGCCENKQAEKELFGGFILLAGENEGCEAENKRGK